MKDGPGEFALHNVFAHDYGNYSFSSGEVYSCGLHPWHIKENNAAELETLKSAAADKRIIAVGECGLDRAIDIPLEKQMEVFLPQLQMAEDAGKPVILHCVRTFPELIQIRRKNRFQVPYIVHGYSSNLQTAEQLASNGIHISFGKYLFNATSRTPQALKGLPEEVLFFESDDSNIPIEEVYKRAAEIRGESVEYLKTVTHRNFSRIFGQSL